MVRELPDEKVAEIVKRWLDAEDVRDVAKATGTSVGSVSKYVNAERERQPDLPDLRNLRQAISAAKVPLSDLVRAAKILRALEDAGVYLGGKSLVRIEGLSKAYGDALEDAIEAGIKVEALEKSEGRSFRELAQEADTFQTGIAALKKSSEGLEAEIRTKKDDLGDLEVYQNLKSDLEKLGMTPNAMARFVAFHNELVELDFTESAARVLAAELRKHGSVPSGAAATLARALSEYESLEEAVSALGEKKKELQPVELQVGVRQKELEALKVTIDSMRDTIKKMEDERDSKRRDLELERVQKAKQTLEKELRAVDDHIAKVRELAVLASLMGESVSPYSKDSVLSVSRAMLMGVGEFVRAHASEILNAKELEGELQTVVEKMGGRVA